MTYQQKKNIIIIVCQHHRLRIHLHLISMASTTAKKNSQQHVKRQVVYLVALRATLKEKSKGTQKEVERSKYIFCTVIMMHRPPSSQPLNHHATSSDTYYNPFMPYIRLPFPEMLSCVALNV